jgi:hypothetical protein
MRSPDRMLDEAVVEFLTEEDIDASKLRDQEE